MKQIFLFVAAFGAAQIFSIGNSKAQTDTGVFNNSSLQATGTKYFVDQAGLQLLQTASPLDDFIDEDNYFLGPYDVLSIYGKGLVEFSYRGIVVNAVGDISTPLIGTITLRGKSLADAKLIITEAFKKEVRDTDIYVTLDQPRPINVHVGGNIPNPGRYTLPAGTRFDALVSGFLIGDEIVTPLVDQSIETILQATSQRPSYSGLNFDKIDAKQQSESEIQNETLSEISMKYDLRFVKVTPLYGEEFYVDLAAYFNSGDIQFAPFIQDGDRITLVGASSSRPTVSISGAVNNPFSGSYRYDDSFQKLLALAGGYSPAADTSEIVLIRITNSNIEEIRMTPEELSEIHPGDQIIIKFAEERSGFGSVRIEGEVELPGTFTIIENETSLGELLDMTGGLTSDALPNAAYLIRSSFDNRGVNSVSSVNLSLLGRSSDQFLEGFDYLEFEQALDPNRMALNLGSQEILENTIMQNGDQLFIPRDENTISILGQVNVPGFYTYLESNSVHDYLGAANGLTIAADPDRVFIIKAGSRAWYKPEETALQSGDIIFVDRVPFEDVSTGRVYEVQIQQLKSERTRLILQGITAVTSIVTAYVAVRRLN